MGRLLLQEKTVDKIYKSVYVVTPALRLRLTIWKRNKNSANLECRIRDVLFISKQTFSTERAIGELYL